MRTSPLPSASSTGLHGSHQSIALFYWKGEYFGHFLLRKKDKWMKMSRQWVIKVSAQTSFKGQEKDDFAFGSLPASVSRTSLSHSLSHYLHERCNPPLQIWRGYECMIKCYSITLILTFWIGTAVFMLEVGAQNDRMRMKYHKAALHNFSLKTRWYIYKICGKSVFILFF